jgi:diguanylate cyclase (GGDEF)-like protein
MVLVILVSVLFCMVFAFIAYDSYMKYKINENNIMTQRFSEAALAGKALSVDYFSSLTAEAISAGRVLSFIGTEDESIGRCFSQQYKTSQADTGLVFSQDGNVSYGDKDLRTLFSKTAEEAMSSGGTAVSDIIKCGDGELRFGIAAAFNTKNGTAAVMLLYPQSVLSKVFENKALKMDGKLWLADSSGNFIAGDETLPTWVKDGKYTLDMTKALAGKLLVLDSEYDGTVYYAYAEKLGINDLSEVYIAPKGLTDEKAQVGFKEIYIFALIGLTFLLIVLGSGIYSYNVRASKLRLYQRKFRIATSQSARAAFEYDKRTDRLTLISECERISLPKPYITLNELSNLVHPYDRGLYGQAVAELRIDGTTSKTVRVAHFAGTDDYRWYNVTATRLTDKGDGKALTIGTVEDIDEREKERLVLYERATTDSLTGLCNRAETEKTINLRLTNLEENEHSAFALIDLDDFKNINDEFGHDFGDKALTFFSDKLRATFRFGDVIGRLGGDEFVVYMTLTSDRKVVEQRLQELMEGLKMPKGKDGASAPKISCSAGFCMASKGDTFEILYKRADNALYESKTLGKAQAIIG